MPTLNYLQLIADSQRTYKSAGVRLNAILKGNFVHASANTAPLSNGFETYTFSDGTTANFSGGLPVVFNNIPFFDIATLQSLLVPAPSRREEEGSANYKMKLAVRKMSPYEEFRRKQELEERVSTSSLKKLYISQQNSVTAGSIVLNGVEYVVLQITTFSPSDATTQNTTLFNAWILSFQSAVKAAVDCGQSQEINNLIIDITGNGGGAVCLSVATRIALFPGYAANNGLASSPSDYRLTNSNYAAVPYLLNNGQQVPQCSTTPFTDFSWFYPPANHIRGW